MRLEHETKTWLGNVATKQHKHVSQGQEIDSGNLHSTRSTLQRSREIGQGHTADLLLHLGPHVRFVHFFFLQLLQLLQHYYLAWN